MKKPLAILAVVLLCLLAGVGGVTLAIGPSGLLKMVGLGGDETVEDTVETYLRDSFQDFLRQLHVSDLTGSYGLAMLKTELLRRARAVGHTDAPHEILIADMVVQ